MDKSIEKKQKDFVRDMMRVVACHSAHMYDEEEGITVVDAEFPRVVAAYFTHRTEGHDVSCKRGMAWAFLGEIKQAIDELIEAEADE